MFLFSLVLCEICSNTMGFFWGGGNNLDKKPNTYLRAHMSKMTTCVLGEPSILMTGLLKINIIIAVVY